MSLSVEVARYEKGKELEALSVNGNTAIETLTMVKTNLETLKTEFASTEGFTEEDIAEVQETIDNLESKIRSNVSGEVG
ncbi:MAG: hypothetical protein GY710_01005 [Desulfobacteraceae bacterium]|nr:hypothetical protein [Desulfobacteraceae bacterium]